MSAFPDSVAKKNGEKIGVAQFVLKLLIPYNIVVPEFRIILYLVFIDTHQLRYHVRVFDPLFAFIFVLLLLLLQNKDKVIG